MADYAEMPSTMWTLIAQARRGGRDALETVLRKYRPPVLSFVRAAGFPPHEAEDVTQEVLLVLVQDDVVAKADRDRGRFRSLLLAVTRHTISAWRRAGGREKRGGGVRTLSLEGGPGDDAPRLEAMLSAPATDDAFDHLWIENLVRIGMNRLREECERDGTPHFRALLMHASEQRPYAEIAAALGVALSDVQNYLHRARAQLKRHVLKEIQEYSSSRDEYDAEAAYLMRFVE